MMNDPGPRQPPPSPHGLTEARPHDDLAEQAMKTAPPWLVSAAIHMGLLILLGLLILPTRSDPRISLEAQIYAEQLGDQLEFDSPATGTETEKDVEPVVTNPDLPEVEDPFAAPPELDVTMLGPLASSTIKSPQIGMALLGRSEGNKKTLLGIYGGNKRTEDAVQLGLKWLAKNQQQNGSWNLRGPYRDGGSYENRSAATAMALLAFAGNGHTHQGTADYAKRVNRGLQWLLAEQDAEGCFFHDGGFNQRFYTQAQCTIVVCELLAMSRDESLRDPAQRAVKYLLESQSERGGWRYRPGQPADVSVTGWVVMALQSARMAGIEIPSENLQRVSYFLDSVAQEDGSRYPYQRGMPPTTSMTAEALLCRQYLGWARTEKGLVRGAKWLSQPQNLVNYRTNNNVYYWYYAAQVLHHMEGDYWTRWNKVMRQEVPAHQIKEGKEAGSWDPSNQNNSDSTGGRLYVTCLSIYLLEVYYRHLPLYSSVYLP